MSPPLVSLLKEHYLCVVASTVVVLVLNLIGAVMLMHDTDTFHSQYGQMLIALSGLLLAIIAIIAVGTLIYNIPKVYDTIITDIAKKQLELQDVVTQ